MDSSFYVTAGDANTQYTFNSYPERRDIWSQLGKGSGKEICVILSVAERETFVHS